MLGQGWRFVKVPVIMQQDTEGNLDDQSYCDHCEKYIIDSGSLANIESWLERTLLTSKASNTGGMTDARILDKIIAVPTIL